MARAPLIVPVLIAVLTAFAGPSACGRDADIAEATDTLSAEDAAAGLRAAQAFTTRPGSTVGRELIAIVTVRRIGRTSTEVEFTWRDSGPAGSAAPVRTSMALFRLGENGAWGLRSLYKVD